MASAGEQSSLSFAPKAQETYKEELYERREVVLCGILNNAHHIVHDLWVGPIASYLSQLYIHTEAHLVMRRCSLNIRRRISSCGVASACA